MRTLTDKELALVRVLQAGGSLLVGPNTLVFVEGKKPTPVTGEVWRSLYELDLIRRGKMVGREYRLHYLTGRGRAVDTKVVDTRPKSQ